MTTINRGIVRPLSLRQAGAALALGTTAVFGAVPATAQDTSTDEVQLDTLRVEDRTADSNPYASKGAPYKARVSGDPRHTRPLAETPQTITVLTQRQILDSGYTDLSRILEAQPGVTVGTGENGNAFGDRYIIRGQEAKSDVFVDGLRDPGMTIRESFAVEQIEISKGPNSSFAGRGTSGGAVNAITKLATTDYNFAKAAVGIGSDRFVRATSDLNYAVNDKVAVRGNLLYGYQYVPERKPADRERKGVATSLLYAPDDALSIIFDYYALRAEDSPDLGGYLLTNPATGARLPAKNLPSYVQNEDFLTSHVDTFTARINYDLSSNIRLTNIARFGESNNAYVTTGIASRTTSVGNPTGVYATSTLDNGHTGWQDVRYVANQTNLRINSELLGGHNELILSGEYTKHNVVSGSFTLTRLGAFNCRTGAGAGALDAFCITGANGSAVSNINTLAQRQATRSPFATRNWEVETVAGSVMDTVDLTPALTVFAGARVDHFKYKLGTYNGNTGVQSGFYTYSDTLWNGHLGVTYKIGKGMIYASLASAADINGGESDTGTSSGYGGLVLYNGTAAGAKPERSLNIELGTKFNLFDDRLLLTASLFQSTKSDVMEGANYDIIGTFNSGENRVRGIELGIAGNVTDRWSVQGGVTLMEAKVLKSAEIGISAAQLALGATNVGKTLANFADFQADVMTRYQLTDQLAFGGAIKHKSKRYGGQPDTAAPFTQSATGFTYSQPVPAYTVGDLFVEMKFNNNIDFRLNVNNVTNADYYTAVYRAGFFLYQGDARSVVGTLTAKF